MESFSGSNAMQTEAPRKQTEMEAALAAAREHLDGLEQGIAQLAERLEPVLPAGYLQGPEPSEPEQPIQAGTMRATEVFAIALRIQRANAKLAAIREAIEV